MIPSPKEYLHENLIFYFFVNISQDGEYLAYILKIPYDLRTHKYTKSLDKTDVTSQPMHNNDLDTFHFTQYLYLVTRRPEYDP